MARNAVRFVRRGRVVELSGFAPTETLLDHLRVRERASGTKEGCAEGDCGPAPSRSVAPTATAA